MLIVYPTANVNTPSIASGTVVLNANPKRNGWAVQNLGTYTLYLGLGVAVSTSVFHVALKGSTANDDGTGGMFFQTEGVVYSGTISVTGTNPRYTFIEL